MKISKILVPIMFITTGVIGCMGIKKFKDSKKKIPLIKDFWKYDEVWYEHGIKHTASVVMTNDNKETLTVVKKKYGDPADNYVMEGKEFEDFKKFIEGVWDKGIAAPEYDSKGYHGIKTDRSCGVLTYANGIRLEVPQTSLFFGDLDIFYKE